VPGKRDENKSSALLFENAFKENLYGSQKIILIFRMSGWTKKFFVLLPVVVLGIFYLYDHYSTYRHVRNSRLLLLALSLLLLYGWMLLEVLTRRQPDFFRMAIQAGFYVYIFMVLTLTGYFILFREVSAHGWWHKMMVRINHRDHVNLQLFKMFKIYKVLSKQIIGNFMMLLPLGIFLPLLYKRITSLFLVLIISLVISTTIELLQLITSFRSADVDDIFLNTLGACTGYLIYKLVTAARKSSLPTTTTLANG
jgi:glycopeptide antibiotics resistance protein